MLSYMTGSGRSKGTSALEGPFPPRKATDMLCQRLTESLLSEQPAFGTPFYSESQLVEISGLSRFTIRRAMTRLSDEGWIERHAGKGTFVGPRILKGGTPKPARKTQSIVRLAVLVYAMGDPSPDCYSHEVLQGIDEAAGDLAVSIELMGNYDADISSLSRRLELTRPDVLAVMPSGTRHALILGQAERLGIPCLLTGTRMLDLGLPTVCEDGAQGSALAVRHLFENGHRRIGMLQRPDSAKWVFERRQGYVNGIEDCGLTHDERLVLWLTNNVDEDDERHLAEYLEREKPTALLAGSGHHAHTFGRLIKSGKLSIPNDLSLVTFDQHAAPLNQLHLGMDVTTISLPLREMGRRIAKLACDTAHGRNIDTLVRLPCTIAQGDSVSRLAS